MKWGATLLDSLPADWAVDLIVVATDLTASSRQIEDAVADTRFTGGRTPVTAINAVLADHRLVSADAVFVCCRGPIAELLLAELSARGSQRPVLVSGLPGISVPAKWRGVAHRAQADLFVLHSEREIADYRSLAVERGIDMDFVLATLPFAQPRRATESITRDSIVFATQAIVPRALAERERLAAILVTVAEANPNLRVVLKVRALEGEPQTHVEEHPIETLFPTLRPGNLIVASGPMREHLDRAVGFASVSSTAVMEAVAAGVPSLLLNDFGVSGELINEVFVGSGLLGTGDELVELRFRNVDDTWRDANYFHAQANNTLRSRLDELIVERMRVGLPARPAVRRRRGGSLRRAWERRLALGEHDRSTLGAVAWVIGTPIARARRLSRALSVRKAS